MKLSSTRPSRTRRLACIACAVLAVTMAGSAPDDIDDGPGLFRQAEALDSAREEARAAAEAANGAETSLRNAETAGDRLAKELETAKAEQREADAAEARLPPGSTMYEKLQAKATAKGKQDAVNDLTRRLEEKRREIDQLRKEYDAKKAEADARQEEYERLARKLGVLDEQDDVASAEQPVPAPAEASADPGADRIGGAVPGPPSAPVTLRPAPVMLAIAKAVADARSALDAMGLALGDCDRPAFETARQRVQAALQALAAIADRGLFGPQRATYEREGRIAHSALNRVAASWKKLEVLWEESCGAGATCPVPAPGFALPAGGGDAFPGSPAPPPAPAGDDPRADGAGAGHGSGGDAPPDPGGPPVSGDIGGSGPPRGPPACDDTPEHAFYRTWLGENQEQIEEREEVLDDPDAGSTTKETAADQLDRLYAWRDYLEDQAREEEEECALRHAAEQDESDPPADAWGDRFARNFADLQREEEAAATERRGGERGPDDGAGPAGSSEDLALGGEGPVGQPGDLRDQFYRSISARAQLDLQGGIGDDRYLEDPSLIQSALSWIQGDGDYDRVYVDQVYAEERMVFWMLRRARQVELLRSLVNLSQFKQRGVPAPDGNLSQMTAEGAFMDVVDRLDFIARKLAVLEAALEDDGSAERAARLRSRIDELEAERDRLLSTDGQSDVEAEIGDESTTGVREKLLAELRAKAGPIRKLWRIYVQALKDEAELTGKFNTAQSQRYRNEPAFRDNFEEWRNLQAAKENLRRALEGSALLAMQVDFEDRFGVDHSGYLFNVLGDLFSPEATAGLQSDLDRRTRLEDAQTAIDLALEQLEQNIRDEEVRIKSLRTLEEVSAEFTKDIYGPLHRSVAEMALPLFDSPTFVMDTIERVGRVQREDRVEKEAATDLVLFGAEAAFGLLSIWFPPLALVEAGLIVTHVGVQGNRLVLATLEYSDQEAAVDAGGSVSRAGLGAADAAYDRKWAAFVDTLGLAPAALAGSAIGFAPALRNTGRAAGAADDLADTGRVADALGGSADTGRVADAAEGATDTARTADAAGAEAADVARAPPRGGAAGASADSTSSAQPLLTADEYRDLVRAQEAGEAVDLPSIARPGIAKLDGDQVVVLQGAGRYEQARPGEYLDLFVPSDAEIPARYGAQVLEEGVSPDLVRNANLLSSRGQQGTNPVIVDRAVAGIPSFKRIRVPARHVQAPTSRVMALIDRELDALQAQNADVDSLLAQSGNMSPAERLEFLQNARSRLPDAGEAASASSTTGRSGGAGPSAAQRSAEPPSSAAMQRTRETPGSSAAPTDETRTSVPRQGDGPSGSPGVDDANPVEPVASPRLIDPDQPPVVSRKGALGVGRSPSNPELPALLVVEPGNPGVAPLVLRYDGPLGRPGGFGAVSTFTVRNPPRGWPDRVAVKLYTGDEVRWVAGNPAWGLADEARGAQLTRAARRPAARIIDVLQDDQGRLYLVTEVVGQDDLARAITRGEVPPGFRPDRDVTYFPPPDAEMTRAQQVADVDALEDFVAEKILAWDWKNGNSVQNWDALTGEITALPLDRGFFDRAPVRPLVDGFENAPSGAQQVHLQIWYLVVNDSINPFPNQILSIKNLPPQIRSRITTDTGVLSVIAQEGRGRIRFNPSTRRFEDGTFGVDIYRGKENLGAAMRRLEAWNDQYPAAAAQPTAGAGPAASSVSAVGPGAADQVAPGSALPPTQARLPSSPVSPVAAPNSPGSRRIASGASPSPAPASPANVPRGAPQAPPPSAPSPGGPSPVRMIQGRVILDVDPSLGGSPGRFLRGARWVLYLRGNGGPGATGEGSFAGPLTTMTRPELMCWYRLFLPIPTPWGGWIVPYDTHNPPFFEDAPGKNDQVAWVEPNKQFGPETARKDPFYATRGTWGQGYDDQWGLKRIGLTPDERTERAMRAAEPVIVAVLDSGLDYSHPDLDPRNVWRNGDELPNGVDDDGNGYVDDLIGWNFVDGNNDPRDTMGHGTHIAGIIAAATGNGEGIAGINPRVRIMPLKILGAAGRGESTGLAEAIFYAVRHGARVINLSIGGAGISETERLAVDYAHEQGVVVVAAAGNVASDTDAYGPAGLASAITVAATDAADRRAGFSNFGSAVKIAAPGVDVLSLRARGTDLNVEAGVDDYTPGSSVVGADGRYYRASGTSFAAPFVAGVASLILSRNPGLTPVQVERMLLMSARDVDAPGWDPYTGAGRLDAAAALAANPDHYLIARVDAVRPATEGNKNVIRVLGTVAASDLRSYVVELGRGEDPGSWKQIGRQRTEPPDDGLLGTVPFEAITARGRWTIRVVARDGNGGQREARGTLNVE